MNNQEPRSTRQHVARRAEIDAVILPWSARESDAMRRFAEGTGGGLVTARALAREFYPFCFEFPLFLAAAISHIRDERARMLLVQNLYEEHGELSFDRIHPALFRNFMRGVGVSPDGMEHGVPGAPGVRAAEWVTSICRNGPAHRPLAALYAIELLFGPICDTIAEGLANLGLPADVTEFFVLHGGADVIHSEQLRAALFGACRTETQWREAVELAREVSRMFYRLFDGIAREGDAEAREDTGARAQRRAVTPYLAAVGS